MSLVERVDRLPTGPGVYLFKSARDRVLYVGKAQNLRARVRQYVQGADGRIRIPKLLDKASDVDVIVTPTVKDALLLENELIKQHKPPFNVRLRDDKQYLALRLDRRVDWPKVTEVRRFANDGAEYFGPYTSSVAMKDALSNLRRIFPIRVCREGTFKDYARRGRPCIEYEMKRCGGPCCGLVAPEAYAEVVRGTALFLKGRSAELVEHLTERMKEAAAEERFEEAAKIRDRLSAVERTVERQQIVAERAVDRDVFGLARSAGEAQVQVLHVREGRVVGTEGYALEGVELDDGGLMTSFLGQFYGSPADRVLPNEVLTPAEIDDDGALEAFFAERRGRRVVLRKPQRGAGRELVALANANANLGLARRVEARESLAAAHEELAERLLLQRVPRRIEGYDVSTLHGTLTVASRVVFEDGKPLKKGYRRYRIKEAAPDDDYACMREVITRRLARAASDPLPDVIMVDGGKGQLGVLTAAIADSGQEVAAISLAKERDAQAPSPRVRRSGGLKAERVFLPGRKDAIRLPPSSRGLLLLQRIRDESHRFAIEFQRALRLKVNFTSILEELPGIGPGKKKKLLREFGSLRGIREASVEEIESVSGIHAKDAEIVHRFFLYAARDGVGPEAHAASGEGSPSLDEEG